MADVVTFFRVDNYAKPVAIAKNGNYVRDLKRYVMSQMKLGFYTI